MSWAECKDLLRNEDLLLNEVVIIPVIGIVKPSFVHLELHWKFSWMSMVLFPALLKYS